MNDRTEPYTEYEGRVYEARIQFKLDRHASDDDVWSWLEHELGGGCISTSHPLYGCEVRGLTVDDLDPCERYHFIDWGAADHLGSRKGRCRIVYTRPAEHVDAGPSK